MDAVEQTGEKIAGELPKGSRVAIVAFESESDNVSDFVMEELTGALFDRGIEVADRQNLDYVYQELKLQMSGDVSDESAKSIGKFLAADMVITGQLLNIGSTYRYRTSAVNVETAVRASVTRLDIKNDTAMKSMVTALANQKTTVKVAKYGVSEDRTPQTAGTFLDRSFMFAKQFNAEKAMADVNEAIRLNPNLAPAYSARAGYYQLFYGDYDKALADFSRAIQIDPNYADAYSFRGAIYFNKGDYDKAISDLTQAIRLGRQQSAVDYFIRAKCYELKGDLDKAIAEYEALLLRTDLDTTIADPAVTKSALAQVYHRRSVIYFNNADYDRAISDLTQVIRLEPNDVAYFGRAKCYELKGDFDKAIADYEAFLRFDPNNPNNSMVRQTIEKLRQTKNRR
jgi:tetratricopeptide (TPR) repeat protein